MARLDVDARDRFLVDVDAWLSREVRPGAGALCAVGAPEVEANVASFLEELLGSGFAPFPDHGLELDCTSPETIGRDRLFAARGAVELLRSSAIVVDCGTALTVDLVTAEPGERPVFRGGAIAPGPALLARALSEHGARLPQFEPRPTSRALGKHTREALESGVAVGLRGAARELVRGLQAAHGSGMLPVLVTGGARAFLTSGAPLAAEVREEPELVHRGLLAALADPEPQP